MKYISLSFLFFLSSLIYALDIKTEKRLENIEKRIDEIEKKLTSTQEVNDTQQETENIPETTGEEMVIKENILKAKISSIKNIRGKKKKGLLLEILIYNPSKYTIKIFTGDLFFYSTIGEIVFSYRAFDDKNIFPGKKISFPVLIPIENLEAYFYFVKYKSARVALLNQRLVTDPL